MESQHGTCTGATVVTKTLTKDASRVDVINVSGTAPIYFTVNGGTPTVAGNDTFVVVAIAGATRRCDLGAEAPVVKLVSSGTPTFAIIAE